MPYNKTPSGEAYLYVSKSRVVGVGNADTGLGLFTYEDIPKNTYVCSYAPTASLKSTTQDGDYAMQLTVAGERISVMGKKTPMKLAWESLRMMAPFLLAWFLRNFLGLFLLE